jgi:cold-inducible RNA-binding protein
MNKIYVGNLPYSVAESDLEALFTQFGSTKEVAVIRDRVTGESKGFGFITFESAEVAQATLELDGKDFSGRPLRVSLARQEERRNDSGARNRNGGHRSFGKNGRRSDTERF